jgi:GT2 family glycosyltransferase
VHYIDHGIKEGRWPDRNFDPAFLLAQYSDVAEVRNNPLFRQILFREQERRIERDLAYQKWYEAHATVSSEERSQIALRLAQLQYQPLISVVLWVGSSSAKRLRGAVASIKSQLYTSWELLIALGASTEALERDVAQQLCGTDQRIRIADQMGSVGQSLALNAAFDMAIGEFILLMGDTGELSETGLYMVVEQLNQDPAADIIYSDEDKLDADGRHHEPHFKPDWNPDLFYGYNYIGNMTVCRSSLVGKVGGLNARFDGAAIYDLMLRMVEQTAASRILHIPFILYHGWSPEVVICSPPEAESQASNAARHALSDHFLRTGRSGVDVVPGSGAGLHRIVWPVPHPQPLVSLVIPPGGKGDLLRNCLFGILDRTDYDNIEVIIPYNAGTRPEVFPYFEEISADPRVTIVDSRSGYNFSRICNLGVARARGGIIGLLNDDIEVIEPGWLREMVSHAMRPEVGIVGAMLYYPNDIIQHAGVILGLGGIDGIAAHVHRSMPRGSHGYFHRAALAQDLSCVTAACLLSRRAVYSEVGGLDENIAVDFSDVDFCIKVRRRGYLIVWTPFAELYHLESATRGEQDSPEKQKQFQHDRDCIKEKWGPELFDRDPYFNPNFRRHSMGHELAAPPRVAKPWLNASHRGRK